MVVRGALKSAGASQTRPRAQAASAVSVLRAGRQPCSGTNVDPRRQCDDPGVSSVPAKATLAVISGV